MTRRRRRSGSTRGRRLPRQGPDQGRWRRQYRAYACPRCYRGHAQRLTTCGYSPLIRVNRKLVRVRALPPYLAELHRWGTSGSEQVVRFFDVREATVGAAELPIPVDVTERFAVVIDVHLSLAPLRRGEPDVALRDLAPVQLAVEFEQFGQRVIHGRHFLVHLLADILIALVARTQQIVEVGELIAVPHGVDELVRRLDDGLAIARLRVTENPEHDLEQQDDHQQNCTADDRQRLRRHSADAALQRIQEVHLRPVAGTVRLAGLAGLA